jgi:hypothetical protein
MRQSRSGDFFVLARVALEAAVPSRDDVLDLLNQNSRPALLAGQADAGRGDGAGIADPRLDLRAPTWPAGTSSVGGEAENIYSG